MGIVDGGLSKSSKSWGRADYLNALDISLYTSRAIDKRAEKVGDIEFILKDNKGNVIERNPVLDLLYKPNTIFTGKQFWKLYQVYYDTIGEVFIYKERGAEFGTGKKLTALHLLNPLITKPKFSETGEIEKFVMDSGNGEKEFKTEDILYIHNPDPKNPLRGQSLLRAGVAAISTEIQIASYHAKILENGGKVEGVFKFKTGMLTKEQLIDLKDQYKKEYAQAKKAGIPLFLGGDSDYVKTGLTPDELSYLEAKKTTLEDICILTSVPKSMLASTADVKFDNADADRVIFLSETIEPLMRVLSTALDEDRSLFPEGQNLTHIDPTPENTEEKRKNLETANAINALTTNEKRQKLKDLGMDLEDVDGGDDVLVPFSLMPLGQEQATDTTKQYKTKAVHPLSDPAFRESYGKVMVKRMDSRERTFKKQLNAYLKEQEQRIVAHLQPNKTRNFRKKDLIDDALNIELEVKIGKDKFLPIVTELVKQAGLDAFDLAGNEYQFNITAGIGSWIDSRMGIFLRSINETTVKKLKQEFEISLESSEGREGLINRIQDTYDGISKGRAGLIARTEVHNATQYGTIEGYRQGGLKTKIWVAVMDDNTRDSHVKVDGEERPLDMPFSNGLMFPGDPLGSAEEVINCRCVI